MPHPSERHHYLAALIILALTLPAAGAAAQDARLAVEVQGGVSAGLTPYRDSVGMFSADLGLGGSLDTREGRVPYLVDENSGVGALGRVRLLIGRFELGLLVAFFQRDTVEVRMRGQEPLPLARRRPDGSLDDHGTRYEAIEPFEQPIRAEERASLMAVGLTGGWRFVLYRSEQLAIYLPVSGGLGQVGISDLVGTSCPSLLSSLGCLGIFADAGLGVKIGVGARVDVILDGRIGGIGAFAPRHPTTATRPEIEGSVEALFDTMIHVGLGAGLQIKIR